MEAEYRSKCPACGEWIEVGDEVVALDDDVYPEDDGWWIHAGCEENA